MTIYLRYRSDAKPREDSCNNSAVDLVAVARGIDDDAALGIGGGDLQKPLAQPVVEFPVETLEAVGIGALCGARQSLRHGQIEDQSQVRGEIAERNLMQSRQIGQWQPSPIALIGQGRIGKAIAHNPSTGPQGRQDQFRDVISPGGVKQKCLANRIPAIGLPFEQQAADRLCLR